MIAGLEIRKAILNEDHDLPYILSSWLRSYKKSYFAWKIDKERYFKWHHEIIKRILNKPETNVLIATDKNDPDLIIGYLVYEPADLPVLHFVHVKMAFQRMGIARELAQAAEIPSKDIVHTPFVFTHRTFCIEPLLERFTQAIYDPYLI